MIRRKIVWVMLIFRGKYNQYNDFNLKNIISEMTKTEIEDIKNNGYSFLWNKLWNKKDEKFDKNFEKFNYVKSNKLELFDTNNFEWTEPGDLKGRRIIKKMILIVPCEFEEETGTRKFIKYIKKSRLF